MTIDSTNLIFEMLTNNEHFSDDPQAFSIWSYTNMEGNQTHAVFYTADHDMLESPFVRDPRLLWSLLTGLTIEGARWLIEAAK